MSTIDSEATLLPTILVNGVHVAGTAAVVKAAVPANSAYTFTANYTYASKGQHTVYKKGATYSLSADVKALLLAASAPMVAA